MLEVIFIINLVITILQGNDEFTFEVDITMHLLRININNNKTLI